MKNTFIKEIKRCCVAASLQETKEEITLLFDGNNYTEGDSEEYDNLSEDEKLKLNVFYNGFRVIYPNDNSRETAESIFDSVEGAIGIVELRSRVGYGSIWGVMVENYNVMS